MCGRFTLRTPASQLLRHFQLGTMPDLQPRYNIAPTQSIVTLRATSDIHRQLVLIRWGLVPAWAKELSIGSQRINARSETITEKPSFRSAFKHRRCLVPADGYFEWTTTTKGKQPFLIRLAGDQPFAFAGLWESWCGTADQPYDPPLETCTIVTTEANQRMADIHGRMPVILHPDTYDLWLDPELHQATPLLPLLKSYDMEEMIVTAVSTHVNRVGNDDPLCVEVQRELF